MLLTQQTASNRKDMSVFLERWFRATRPARITIGLIYLFVAFTIPLHHTCGLCGPGPQSSNCDDNCHHSCCKISSCNQPNISSKQIDHKDSGLSNPGLCMACVYSVTSNATQVNAAVAILRNEVLSSAQSLPSLSVIRQSEWLSSVCSRAPPIINS